jgi:hypothetical protein
MVTDQPTLDGIPQLVEQLRAEKISLHREQAK